MNRNYKYYIVKEHGAAYRVQPGCCIRKVVFDGPVLDIVDQKDDPHGDFNSEHLLCQFCDPNLHIQPISRWKFEELFDRVMQFKTERANRLIAGTQDSMIVP